MVGGGADIFLITVLSALRLILNTGMVSFTRKIRAGEMKLMRAGQSSKYSMVVVLRRK
jgi:hypothetical protein